MKGILTVALKILGFVTLWGLLLLPFILIVFGRADPSAGDLAPGRRAVLEIASALTILVAAAIMLRFVDRRPFRSLGFGGSSFASESMVGLVAGAALLLLAIVPLAAAGWIRSGPGASVSGATLGILAIALFANSVTQEVTVRGYVLQTIEARFGAWPAILGSSAFFVLLHAGALVEGAVLPIVNLLLAGVFFALSYEITRNLWFPIAAHFSWNFLLGPVLGLSVSGVDLGEGWSPMTLYGPAWATGGEFGLEGGLATTLALTIGCVVLLSRWRRGETS